MNSNGKSWGKKIIAIISALAFVPALLCICSTGGLLLSWNPSILWSSPQRRLANELDVNIKDYPSPKVFPLGYYETRLSSGTDILEVHQVISGYSKVLNCDEREVYYYFSSDGSYALRIEVWYNDDLTVSAINGEDEDSRTIRTDGCTEGRIRE